jgi:hypothetical protein
MARPFPREHFSGKCIPVCIWLCRGTCELEYTNVSDQVLAIGIVLDMLDDSFAATAFALVRIIGGMSEKWIIEVSCCIAEGIDLELGHNISGQVG